MLNSILQELRQTFRVILWLYRDAVWRYRWSSLLIVTLDVIAIVLAGTVIGGVLKTAQAISRSESIALPFGLPILDPNVSSNLMWLGAGFFVIGFTGAIAFWYTRRTTRLSAARYQNFCTMRALRLLQSEEPAYWMLSAETKSPLMQLRYCTGMAPQMLNRCFDWVMESIRSTILMFFMGAVLIYLNPLLCLGLIPLAIVYLFILSKLSRKASDSDRIYQESREVYKQACHECMSHHRTTSQSPPALEALLRKTDTLNSEMTNELAKRRLVVSQTQFLNLTLLALIVAIIYIIFAIRISEVGTDWSTLIVFVICLKFFIGGLKSTTAVAIRLQLFALQLEMYERVIDASPEMPDSSKVSRSTIETILASPSNDEAETKAPLMFVVPWQPTEFDLPLGEVFLHRFAAGDANQSCLLTKDNQTIVLKTLRQKKARWIIGLFGHRKEFSAIEDYLTQASPKSRPRLILFTSLKRKPTMNDFDVDASQPDVLLWSEGGIHEQGDWPWYVKNWAGLLESYQLGRGSPGGDGDLDDED